jgi:ParB-like chromosome segregation protein Spo0J
MASCIEHSILGRSVPDARNEHTHNDHQTAHIAAFINEFGFVVNPIPAGADHVAIAGHVRLHAARKLGLSEVPVIVLDGLLDYQRLLLILADNKLALNAGWDEEAPHSNKQISRKEPT